MEIINKIMDFLKKIGFLRVGGVAATYKNAKDRPVELMDDMFLGKSKQVGGKTISVKPNHPTKKFVSITLIALIIFILLALTTSIAWLIIIVWVIWMIYIWLIFTNKIVAFGFSIVMVFIILCFVSLVMVLVTQTDSKSSKTSVSTTKALSSAECKPFFDKYNNKVLKISSDGLQGTIGIKIDMSAGCKLHGFYNVLLSSNLPQNLYKRDIRPSYHYTVMLRSSNQTTRSASDEFGTLSPVYMNFKKAPGTFDGSTERLKLYSNGSPAVATKYFSWGYEIDTNFSEARYQQILDDTKLDVVNGTPFIEEESSGGSAYSYWVDDDKAAASGDIVKSYSLIIK